jgi:uncharacterized membrane protein YkvA (DUF1232 family)
MVKRLFGNSVMDWYRKLIRHSRYRWVVLLGTLVYLVSPIDISPDVIPLVGWIDDGLVATIAITEITQMLVDRKRRLKANIPADGGENSSHEVIDVKAMRIS